ncbi:MAG: transketolase [Verrucomicrobia bacterium]|nr:MAG: transketolase [Verrucomicrobiota bacterium]
MNTPLLTQAANEARGLAIDAIHACSSGHLGLPLGSAEIGAVLFGQSLRFNPEAPKWLNRDRFILSAGHGSMFLYGWLHLAGYAVSREALKNFRQWHSITPGHPEFRETPGVEATTGPLGQGVANAVGYALSGKRAAARFNTAAHTIFDHHVVSLLGDGCLQEGVAREAIAFAGHQGLDNLILIYDSNDVTLDAMAAVTQSENAEQFFHSQGWDAVTVDGHDLAVLAVALEKAKADDNGRPKVIIAKTVIAKGIAEVAGTAKGHGEGGAKFSAAARAGLGLPADELFYVSPAVQAYFAAQQVAQQQLFTAWQATFDAWSEANPELAAELTAGVAQAVPSDLSERIPAFAADYKDATRAAAGVVINAVAKAMPHLLTGSADLYGSTKNYISGGGDLSRENPTGRNLWFGIREHAMGGICNGIAYDGLFRPSAATFLVFADYMRGSIRLAALAGLPVTYIFTHDSVGVGEDGPTHQPVETVSGLRVIPNLDVIRPADAEETAGAWVVAMHRTNGPTALILTRQTLPLMNELPVATRRDGVLRGGYIARQETAPLTTILLSCGSELQHALAAATQLGAGVRVVSVPCFERFDRQSPEYRESVLPQACSKRVAIEAGVSGLWWKYVGSAGRVLGIDRFGISAPAHLVMEALGMTPQHVITAVQELG